MVGLCAMHKVNLRLSIQLFNSLVHRSSREEERIGLPDVALKCAKSVGINWVTSGVGECAGLDGSGKGSEGVSMLRGSAKHSAKLNITLVLRLKSPGQATESNLQEKLHNHDQRQKSMCP
jgi:hypothetical protein